MSDTEDWKEEAQWIANAVRDEPAAWGRCGVHPLGTDKQTALYGTGGDHEAAQEAVDLLRERLTPMAVKELASAFDSTDSTVWVVVVDSPGVSIETKVDQLKKEVEKAHRDTSEPK